MFVVHAIAGIEFSALLQLTDKSLLIICKHFYLFDDCHIQCIAVCVFAVAHGTLAALFHFAHIGVNHLAVSSFSLAHLRIHTLTAAAEQQTGQQRFVTAWFSERLGLVAFQ